MARFKHGDIGMIQQAISAFGSWFAENVTKHFDVTGLAEDRRKPSEWGKLADELASLETDSTKGGGQGLDLPDKHLTLLKRVMIVRRRAEAERIRRLQDRTHHLEVLGALDEELERLDRMASLPWFRATNPRDVPQVTDLLPVQRVEELLGARMRLPERKYDEKFHILQAPDLFLQDLECYRTSTDLRGSATSVAFVDIDDFKKFNSDHTETGVDRNMLPRFMREIEAHLHFHGQAYRQGGDEYLILLPGFSQDFGSTVIHMMVPRDGMAVNCVA